MLSMQFVRGIIVSLFCVVLSSVFFSGHLVHAREKYSHFSEVEFDKLEAELRETHGIENLARDLADLREYEFWPEDKDPKLKLYIAMSWLNDGHIEAARDLLVSLDVDESVRNLWNFALAKAHILAHAPELALDSVVELEKQFPQDVGIKKLKASYLVEKGDLTSAIEVMNELLDQHKQDGDAYLQRGSYHVMAFSTDMALVDFNKATKKLPKYELTKLQQAYLQMGIIYYKVKLDQKKAAEYLKKGVAINPESDLVRQVRQVIQANLYQ